MLDMENRKEQFTVLFHVRLIEKAVMLAGLRVNLVSAVDTRARDIQLLSRYLHTRLPSILPGRC